MPNPIRFVLNGQETEIAGLSPSTTVLDWLRGPGALPGTKEGCGEGDCGACTIAVAEPRGGGTAWRALNSCLLLMPQIDGCAVMTVEGLKRPGGALHPVQRAMVDSHGTQCGFCTPGFVMAMFAYHAGGEAAGRESTHAGGDASIHDALAGNLCRCTGYRPIVDAMRTLGPTTEAAVAPRVWDGSNAFTHRREKFHAPRDVDHLLELREKYPKAIVLGGGTDLGLLVSKRRQRFATVISLARVEALRAVREVEDRLEIGGAATYTDALPSLEKRFPAFGALVRRIGSRQIRNVGTLAGNLGTASPIGDTLPCLIALDAKVQLLSRQGQRDRTVEDFVLGYRKTGLRDDEIIAAIRVPFLAPGDRFFAYKISKRFDQDISAVVAAFRLRLEGDVIREARLAFGGMADRPKRAASAEQALLGRPFDEAAVAAAAAALADDFSPISDFRASAEYRRTIAGNLLRRAQAQVTAPATASEVGAL